MNAAFATLSRTHLDVLYLLVIGTQRLAIARDLYLSTRTVDQRIAEMKHTLGASDRFGLGVSAVRRRSIDPVYPITHASARRVSPGWVEPTRRQYEILRLRGGGASIHEAAKKTETSTSSVRRDLSQLATDNGARNAISAGALFEALGWT